MNIGNNERAALVCTPFVSYAILKADRKIRIDIGSDGSNIWDLICPCGHLAYLAMLRATL